MQDYIKLSLIGAMLFLMWRYGPNLTALMHKKKIEEALLSKLLETPYKNHCFSVIWQNNSTLMKQNFLESSIILKSSSGVYLFFNFILPDTTYISEISEDRAITLIKLTPSAALKTPYEIGRKNA